MGCLNASALYSSHGPFQIIVEKRLFMGGLPLGTAPEFMTIFIPLSLFSSSQSGKNTRKMKDKPLDSISSQDGSEIETKHNAEHGGIKEDQNPNITQI